MGDGGPSREIIVIGGSAGAADVLVRFLSDLPSTLPAAVFIVVHVLPASENYLPALLRRVSALPVRAAHDGDRIEPGRILIAPPDRHMILHVDHVELTRGPTENSSRPAIDPLFRSAAESFGPGVCALLLSGHLSDGTIGLRRVATCGGVAMAQDPSEALYPEMPRNGIAAVQSCLVIPPERLAASIVAAATGKLESTPIRDPVPAPALPSTEGILWASDVPGTPSGLTCPECHGALWSDEEPGSQSLRCRIGHRFSYETLEHLQRVEVERAMLAAVRALREEAVVAGRIAATAESGALSEMAERFREREQAASHHADVVLSVLQEPFSP